MRKIELNEQEVINDYLQNQMSQQKIAEKYKVSRSVVKRILSNNEVTLRDRTTKYKANYDIFETIDTVEKAYWLGFIAADGCNYSREHNASIIINIKQKDIEQLEKFKSFC